MELSSSVPSYAIMKHQNTKPQPSEAPVRVKPATTPKRRNVPSPSHPPRPEIDPAPKN